MKFKEEKLNQILHAGTDEFLERGFEAASMHNIGINAEVSKRTLYRYFPTKDDLLNAIIDKLLDKMLSYCQLDYVKGEKFVTQLTRVIDSRIEFLTSKDFTNMSRLTLSEMIRGRKLHRKHMEKIARIDGHFISWLDAAKKDKKVRDDYDSFFISGQFHSIIKGEVFYPVVMGLKSVKEIDTKFLKKFLLRFMLEFFCNDTPVRTRG